MYNCITNKHHILYDPYRLYLAEHRRQPLEPYMPFWSRLFARGNPIQKEQIPHVGRGARVGVRTASAAGPNA